VKKGSNPIRSLSVEVKQGFAVAFAGIGSPPAGENSVTDAFTVFKNPEKMGVVHSKYARPEHERK
jgi:hypothetical protein